ncbi:polysaccharide deacetylase family protein [Paenibacillus sp. OV219]|uniref:polysaccharide deacetylase family protein n=1 Tax=Paenibacillus sp. OV219 TaxID=1884377 RepID=UPI0008C69DBA|nr:polysaccharide deacetylase family protein [Paenibacillus sp. OV219]SEP12156.1 biofilm PGA synthesis lipoprotein PgaB [Paenibacillus sp. OV219]
MNRKLIAIWLLFIVAAICTGGYYMHVKGRTYLSRTTTSANRGNVERRVAAGNRATARRRSSASPQRETYYSNKVIVLMYHEVAAVPKDDKALPLRKFEQQLSMMKADDFHWITMKQYEQFILHGAPVPDNAVLMTFDDGYESYYTDTYPVLKKYHVPATNFLIVNTIGNPHHIGIQKLNWQQVEEMHKSGYDFYNHTFDSHLYVAYDGTGKRQKPALASPMYLKAKHRKETAKEYRKRVTSDLAEANTILSQKLGIDEDKIVAFPYGAYNKQVLDICRKLGIHITFTVKSGINAGGQTNGYRVNAGGIDDNPDTLIQLMKQGGHSSETEKETPLFFIQMGVFGTALIGLVLMRSLVNVWEDKHRRRIFRKSCG